MSGGIGFFTTVSNALKDFQMVVEGLGNFEQYVLLLDVPLVL